MKAEDLETLTACIETAYALAERGDREAAVHQFATARVLSGTRADQALLTKEVQRQYNICKKERDYYREDARVHSTGRPDAGNGILVLADSLGLPRAYEMETPRRGAEVLYPNLLGRMFPDRVITSLAQRLFTTSDAVAMLEAEPDLGRDASIILHMGLNDAARRMYIERHRISLALLPEAQRDRIVRFGQVYRKDILQYLPPLFYTDCDQFVTNIDRVISLARERKARRVVLLTIIVPPLRSWAGTPHAPRYFAEYNLRIMTTALRHDMPYIDFDRHVWASMESGPLNDDGMHLSAFGHQLLATELAKVLR